MSTTTEVGIWAGAAADIKDMRQGIGFGGAAGIGDDLQFSLFPWPEWPAVFGVLDKVVSWMSEVWRRSVSSTRDKGQREGGGKSR